MVAVVPPPFDCEDHTHEPKAKIQNTFNGFVKWGLIGLVCSTATCATIASAVSLGAPAMVCAALFSAIGGGAALGSTLDAFLVSDIDGAHDNMLKENTLLKAAFVSCCIIGSAFATSLHFSQNTETPSQIQQTFKAKHAFR